MRSGRRECRILKKKKVSISLALAFLTVSVACSYYFKMADVPTIFLLHSFRHRRNPLFLTSLILVNGPLFFSVRLEQKAQWHRVKILITNKKKKKKMIWNLKFFNFFFYHISWFHKSRIILSNLIWNRVLSGILGFFFYFSLISILNAIIINILECTSWLFYQ